LIFLDKDSLEDRFVDLFSTRITDEGLKRFGEALQRLRTLKSFNLRCECTSVTDDGLKNLCEGLGRSLEFITLNFRECDISERGIFFMSKELKRIGSLKLINLDFGFCQKIRDDALYELSQCLKRLGLLHSVKLDLGSCEITDKGLSNLNESFDALQFIKVKSNR